jgi:LEA14-like dessication related protein
MPGGCARDRSRVLYTGAMPKPWLPGRVAAVAAACALAACASLGERPIPPQVSLAAITAGVSTGEGARAHLTFAVYNPNAFDLAVRSLDYQLSVDGRQAAAGALAEPVRLAAGETTKVGLDVRVDLREMGRALDHALRRGQLPYEVSGTLVLADGVRLPFRRADTVDLQPAAPAH